MFGDIVVGVDESPGGRDALALAKRLVAPDARLTLAHVIVIHAWQTWASGAARAAGERQKDLERERAHELLCTARDQSAIAIRCGEISLKSVWSSSVGRGLHELAEDQGADLLVLGSSRRGLLGRVAVGDDTRAALNGAPCAVAVAPAGYADHFGDIRQIGVGYDGSLESETALEIARRLSVANDAELSACTAVSVPLPAIGPGPMPLTDVIEPLLDKARERITQLGGVTPLAGYGPPLEVLASYSDSVDLLVVGSRAYGPLGRLIHGSTSDQLARVAHCALLVLPRSARRTATDESSEEQRRAVVAGRD